MARKPYKLYSIYRNSDDALMKLDVTADECCKFLGVKKEYFYNVLSPCGGNHTYTIVSISAREAQKEATT